PLEAFPLAAGRLDPPPGRKFPDPDEGYLGEGIKPHDDTGSGYGFRFMCECHAKDMSYEQARAAILADKTKAGEWANRVDERQLERAWKNSKPGDGATAGLKIIRVVEGEIVLDPRDPMHAARTLVATRFMDDGRRLLHRHRGTFWRFHKNRYVLADQETVRAEVWQFLESAQRLGGKNKPEPFKPNRARVSDVLDALTSVCGLDNLISPPAWLNGAH